MVPHGGGVAPNQNQILLYWSIQAEPIKQKSSIFGEFIIFPRGATRMARGGIRLIHGLTKSTLITYFSGTKKDPKYAFLHAFFLNLPIMFFPKFVYTTKNTPFFPILHVFAPLNDVRAYSAWSWKTTLIMWIFGWAWYPPWHSSGLPGYIFPPSPMYVSSSHKFLALP